jgi:hypothetical protein
MTSIATARTAAELRTAREAEQWAVLRGLRAVVAAGGELSVRDAMRLRMAERGSAAGLAVAIRQAMGG